ncbi:hypothetical protein R3W88_027590 [Solanum pinnatisectum]|uniref:Ubiquitin-like domain-containing protein n=1 Tax=Solanum pinnatisectum TaxID=50273 RepID=A0AAV9LGF3_9SOLN|nr:hypothetical protein R3W88_027590 [Solanum pinnatisectum]
MDEPQKIRFKVESETSEFSVTMKETDKVKDLVEIVKANFGDDLYYTLEHNSIEMKSDQALSTYNLKDGSIVNVTWSVDSP